MYILTDLDNRTSFKNFQPFFLKDKSRINILALGDVGGTLLTGLKMMGADVVERIGICDMNADTATRYEMEMNQIVFPFDGVKLPEVEIITAEELFNGDVFVFCASKGIPALDDKMQDVRMAQFENNKKLVEQYAALAADKNFKGLFAVVSDPVDPLCKAAYLAGRGKLFAEQIKGFGLGVMNSRAMYHAKKNNRFQQYLKEGRAFGPHGQDLVIADSLLKYDDKLSRELTQLTVESNLRIRELGFKPYIAPAISSGAISILLLLRGQWHYSSSFIGKDEEGAYVGALNRMTEQGLEFENIPIPEELFLRIKNAYDNLKEIV